MLGELSDLRPAYTARPAWLNDVDTACALRNDWSMKMKGVAIYDAEEMLSDWQIPGFNLETDTVLVHEDGSLVGLAFVWDTDQPHVRVHGSFYIHPDHSNPDLESALLQWIEARARKAIDLAPHEARVIATHDAFSVDENRKTLLVQHGYQLVRHFVRLRIEMDEPPTPPRIPAGIVIRPFNPQSDLRATAIATRDAFRDHWGFVENDLEEEIEQWRHWVYEDPTVDPSLWYVACNGEEIVGLCNGAAERPEADDLAYIHIVAVRKPWRGRGIARALLQHAFAGYYGRGKTVVDLDADAANLAGAMRLYEGVGMKQVWRSDAYEKEIRPGVDLMKRG